MIGMTSLFIASKVEEIYPPKLKDLATHMELYASNAEQMISDFEIYMLKTLEWRISPVTPNTWLLAYLQIASTSMSSTTTTTATSFDNKPKIHNAHYVMPLPNLAQTYHWTNTSASVFKREAFFLATYLKAVTLLDLCLLDVDSLRFRYSELAAAALYLMMSIPSGLQLSQHHHISISNYSSTSEGRVRLCETWTGLSWRELEPCVNWMLPYADVCRDMITEERMIAVRQFSSVEPDDMHNIQIYHKYLELWVSFFFFLLSIYF